MADRDKSNITRFFFQAISEVNWFFFLSSGLLQSSSDALNSVSEAVKCAYVVFYSWISVSVKPVPLSAVVFERVQSTTG